LFANCLVQSYDTNR